MGRCSLKYLTGIYKINCSDCDKFYIGQTGRGFLQRFKEHLPKNNIYTNRSQFAKHLISEGHNYNSFESNFKAIHICDKGLFMNAVEEFEIYQAFKFESDNVLNEQLDFRSHYLYDTILNKTKRHSVIDTGQSGM